MDGVYGDDQDIKRDVLGEGGGATARVHAALVSAHVLFGAGSVVAALGLNAISPLMFSLIREVGAGTLLVVASVATTGLWPRAALPEWRRFFGLGLMLYLNQVAFIIGVKLANPVAGSVWQPSQPIITAAIAMFLGPRHKLGEPFSCARVLGILLAFGGCAAMVVLSAGASGNRHTAAREVAGNAFFLLNCTGGSLFVLLSRPALEAFPPVCVIAWAYVAAAGLTLATALAVSASPSALAFLCPECDRAAPFRVPVSSGWALAYWVLAGSALCFFLLTWANKRASATLIVGYSALQPVTAMLLTVVLILCKAYPECGDGSSGGGGSGSVCLPPRGLGDLGALGVFAGLYLVARTEPGSGGDGASDLGPLARVESIGTTSTATASRLAREVLAGLGFGGSGGGASERHGAGHISGLGSSEDPPAYIRSSSFTATPLYRSVDVRSSMDWGSESSVGDHPAYLDDALNNALDAALIARPAGSRR